MRTLAAIHVVGNAVLLGLGYYWLGIGETRAATLLWSALIAVVLLLLASYLHAATLKTSVRRLLPVAIGTIAVYLLLARFTAPALWPVRWIVIPVIALALATGSKHWQKPLYWLEVPILLLCAVWLPLKLMAWVPHVGNFGLQMFSFTLRALAAYLLFVGGTLALEFLTQSNRVASP